MKLKQFGDKLSDTISDFSGSWAGIITCVGLISLWIFGQKFYRFDAKPYILLNLVLSISAALSGPFIIMSNNRKDQANQKEIKELLKLIKEDLEETKSMKQKVENITNGT